MPLPRFDNTLGALLVGLLAAAVMYGITCVQTYIYYGSYLNDRWHLKSLVGFLWTIDTLHLITISHMVYHYTVTNFANPLGLNVPTWSLPASVVLMTTSDTLIRCFFSYRIWKLSNVLWPTILVLINTVIVWGNAIASAVKIAQLKSISDISHFAWLVRWEFGAAAGTDILITVILCFLLYRKKTGFKQTDFLVSTLIIYTINTGALTTVLALICMIVNITQPTTYVYMGIYFTLPKFFLNALLATLNARHPQATGTGVSHSTPMELASGGSLGQHIAIRPDKVQVQVSKNAYNDTAKFKPDADWV